MLVRENDGGKRGGQSAEHAIPAPSDADQFHVDAGCLRQVAEVVGI